MSSNQCFHFTYLNRANQINKQGLMPRIEENSKTLNDTSSKISFSDGKYATAGLFANFYRVYEDIKSGRRTAENSNTSQEMIDKIKKSDSFEQFLGDGMYLMFDGTNIENTGGNNGHINPFDAGTKENIPPEMLKVCMLQDKKTGEKTYSKYDYALYLMCTLTEDDLSKMPKSMRDDIEFYKENHQNIKEKLENGEYVEEQIALDEFCTRYYDEIAKAEYSTENNKGKIQKVKKNDKQGVTLQEIGKETTKDFTKNPEKAMKTMELLEYRIKTQEEKTQEEV